jgi:hypothetical protein
MHCKMRFRRRGRSSLTLGWLVAVHLFALAESARADDRVPILLVRILFKPGGPVLGSINRTTGFVRNYYGIPQKSPLFMEVLGPTGDVQFARPFTESNTMYWDSMDPKTGRMTGGSRELPKTEQEFEIPDVPDMYELVLWRRDGAHPKRKRTMVLRAKLR